MTAAENMITSHGNACIQLDKLDRQLLDRYQRSFPLSPRPYQDIAEQLGVSEETVLERLQNLSRLGFISRIGPVFRTHSIGVSTLAAMQVPEERLAETAALVNGYREVNHNYEREHHYNLWFVLTAEESLQLERVLDAIEQQTGYKVLRLPMLEDYHIDLGFKLQWT